MLNRNADYHLGLTASLSDHTNTFEIKNKSLTFRGHTKSDSDCTVELLFSLYTWYKGQLLRQA